MKNNKYKLIILAIISFSIGFLFRSFILNKTTNKKDFTIFWDVWETMEEKYPFTEPSKSEKINNAIKGLVNSYKDDYSMFFSPEFSKQFHEDIDGRFGGAGMEIGLKDGYLIVIAPLKNSPSEKAGFKAGDIITHIEDEVIYGKDINYIISLIRGDVGTELTMTVVRLEDDDVINITLTRDIIKIPVLDTEIINNTFIISLYNFNQDSMLEFKNALIEFKNSELEYLLLDLRNNPGGYLSESIDLLSYFLDQGLVLVEEDFGDSGKKRRVHRSRGFDLLKDYNYKLKVLINKGSASASEIVAGALQDYEAATIIGETSFGKGSVQELIDFDKNTSLKVTVAKWFTPKNKQISKKGITPDVFIEDLNSLNLNTIIKKIK